MRARVDANTSIFLGCIDATLVSIEAKLRARSREIDNTRRPRAIIQSLSRLWERVKTMDPQEDTEEDRRRNWDIPGIPPRISNWFGRVSDASQAPRNKIRSIFLCFLSFPGHSSWRQRGRGSLPLTWRSKRRPEKRNAGANLDEEIKEIVEISQLDNWSRVLRPIFESFRSYSPQSSWTKTPPSIDARGRLGLLI